MKKNIFFTIGFLIVLIMLGACGQTLSIEPEKSTTPAKKTVDPLTEARSKLYQEIGLDEKGNTPTVRPEEPLPLVAPNPPELPTLDANAIE